jgi:hypothetical protein
MSSPLFGVALVAGAAPPDASEVGAPGEAALPEGGASPTGAGGSDGCAPEQAVSTSRAAQRVRMRLPAGMALRYHEPAARRSHR